MCIRDRYTPQQYLEKQSKYGNLLRGRHFGAKKRPAGDALASSECNYVFLVSLNRWIFTKHGTIPHVSESCWKGLQGQGSKVTYNGGGKVNVDLYGAL